MCVVLYLFLFRSLFCVSQLGWRKKCQRMAEPYLANYLTSKIIRLRLNRSHQNRQFFISFYYLEEIYHNLQLANLFADIHSQETCVLCCVTSSSFFKWLAQIFINDVFFPCYLLYTSFGPVSPFTLRISHLSGCLRVIIILILLLYSLFFRRHSSTNAQSMTGTSGRQIDMYIHM